MTRRLIIVIAAALTLAGCGIKDPSFYDLKSPCVSVKFDELEEDPCARTSPVLNQLYSSNISNL